MERFCRNIPLIGEAAQRKLAESNVLVVGVGGVGGYALEMLTRSGVGKFTIVDMDVVESSNINRQIIAASSTLKLPKVDAFEARMKDINPSVSVRKLFVRFGSQTKDEVLSENFDYCVDAIDSVRDKIELICACKNRSIPIISALGAGNRLDCDFIATDIFLTEGDRLARAVRSELRKAGVTEHKVVYSPTPALITSVPPASISFAPAVMGCILAKEVIKDLICLS